MLRRVLLLALVSAAACKGSRGAGGAGIGGGCSSSNDCADPLQCVGGVCALPADLQACTPNALACSGNSVVACDATGLKLTTVEECPIACRGGACVQVVCKVGDRQCSEAGVQQCESGPGGAPAWVLATPCSAGCNGATVSCRDSTCKPLDTRCSPDLQVCSSDGLGWIDEPCASGSACGGGQCVRQKCAPGAVSCDGSVLETCDATGAGFSSQVQCPAGCANGKCLSPVCVPGAARCSSDGSAVEQCKPDGSGWTLVANCPPPGCASSAEGRAACALQICAPLTKRCDATSTAVQVCAGDGSGWSTLTACSDGCSNGACVAPPQGCAAGALRCAGNIAQRCDGANWSEVAECPNGCANGACLGASCVPGFTLSVATPRPAIADGISTLLVVSGIIAEQGGAPIDDGTVVRLAATGGAQIVSPASTALSHGGVVDFAVRAPAAAGTIVVTATIEGASSCAAGLPIAFAAAPGGVAYAAEDFSTDLDRDFANTSAQWTAGGAISTSSELGDGRDAAFTVPGGSWDLTTRVPPTRSTPYAATLAVSSVGAQSVTVTGSAANGFAAGDEAMLIELQGASASATAAAGAWELLTVAASSDGQVSFTTPVLGVYGEKPGANLAGQRVILQRVPHFTSVSVPAGATLTAAAWDGQKGGVLAFRASGTVSVAGAISADALGFRSLDSSDALHDQPGESYGGFALASTSPAPFLGGGGGGYLCGDPFHLNQLDTWYGSGGSYGSQGASTCGDGGATYGAQNLSRLLFGSASGSQEQNAHKACASRSDCPTDPGIYTSYRSAAYALSNNACGAYAAASNAFGRCKGTATFAQQARPCGGDRSCASNGTFNSCPGTASDVGAGVGTQGRGDGSACFSACPGLQGAHSDGSTGAADACTSCGCGTWGFHDCYHDECFGNSSHCNGAPIRWEEDGCETFCDLSFSCPHSYDTCDSTGCGFLGLGSPCFQPVYTCWHGPGGAGGGQDCDYAGGAACNSCSTCPADEFTNGSAVHCAINPGCCTNPGCEVCGSCAAGDTTCDFTHGTVSCPNPWQAHAAGGRGGGIVFAAAGVLDLSAGGTVSAAGGAPANGNFGGAGGSIFLKIGTLRLAASGVQISAAGASGGGAGRVRLDRMGGDDPVARGQVSPAPYAQAFLLPQAQSKPVAIPAGRLATGVQLVTALDSPVVAYSISSDGGRTWAPLPPGATMGFASPSADVRWRASLTPQGAPAIVRGLSLLLTLQ